MKSSGFEFVLTCSEEVVWTGGRVNSSASLLVTGVK